MSAAAPSPLVWCLSLRTFFVYVFCLCGGEYMYSHQDLIDIRFRCSMDITSDFQRNHNIPDYIARPAESPWVCFSSRQRRPRRERKQKRGLSCTFAFGSVWPPLLNSDTCLHTSYNNYQAMHQNHQNVTWRCSHSTAGLLWKHLLGFVLSKRLGELYRDCTFLHLVLHGQCYSWLNTCVYFQTKNPGWRAKYV